ncbi:MAG: LemA family protein [Candidatus Uhrbacteria bacterium]|nr:LemA family protein [Candidatus Uhrbacteria bacterium]
MPILWILIILLVLLGLWLILSYNGLISLRNRSEEAWSDIEVQMKRRYDLIPNLVNTVKGYATHESSVFENVTTARTAAMGAHTPAEHAKAESALTGTLKTLFAVSENYPVLQASQNFLELQHELTDAEDKIQAARRFYNGNIRAYNTSLQSFPTNLMAGMFAFVKKEFFEMPENEKVVPEVKF